jgi:hypothetical protein
MKKIILLSILLPWVNHGATTHTEILQEIKEFNIPKGEVWEILSFRAINGSPALVVDAGTLLKATPLTYERDLKNYKPLAYHPGLGRPLFLAGPFAFKSNGNIGLLTYRKHYEFSNSAYNTGNGTGMNTTIVIPENTAGKVKVLMESSTDLVTWTPAELGDYEPSNQKRFYRLRAVQAASTEEDGN